LRLRCKHHIEKSFRQVEGQVQIAHTSNASQRAGIQERKLEFYSNRQFALALTTGQQRLRLSYTFEIWISTPSWSFDFYQGLRLVKVNE